MGRQCPVVPRGTDRAHDSRRRRRLSQRHRQVPGRVLRHPAGASTLAPWITRRRRGLPELRVSTVLLRQPLRGRLVARTSALHGAHAERRDLYRTPGSRRVRTRRADADQRSRSRTRRQHLPDDRRRRRTGWALQGELDGAETSAAGHDRRARRRAATATDLELGLGGDRACQNVDGGVVCLRAREAGANGDGGIGRPRPRRAGDAAAWRNPEPRVADGAGQGSRRRRTRRGGLRRRRADQRGRQGGRCGGAQGRVSNGQAAGRRSDRAPGPDTRAAELCPGR